MTYPLNQSLKFRTYLYNLDGELRTDLVVNVEVQDPLGALIVSDTAEVVGDGYEYELDGAEVDAYGDYTCIFTPVDDGNVAPIQEPVTLNVSQWATRIDVSVGSRLASGNYTVPPNTTQIQTAVEAGLTAQGYTEERSLLLDNLDEAISGLPSPLDATQTAAAVQTGLTAQGYTTTRAGFLDTLNGLVTAIWSYADRSFTSFATAVTLNLRQLVPDVPVVNPYLLHLVYGDSYSFNDGRSLGWQFSEAQCPVLTEADVPRLKFINLTTGTVVLNITGTAIDGTRQVYFEPTATNMQIGDNTGDLQLAFEVSITRPSTNIITPIPASKGKAVVYRSI